MNLQKKTFRIKCKSVQFHINIAYSLQYSLIESYLRTPCFSSIILAKQTTKTTRFSKYLLKIPIHIFL